MISVLLLSLFPLSSPAISLIQPPVQIAGKVSSRMKTAAKIGRVDLNCNRDTAQLFINGHYRGLIAEFNGLPGKLQLPAGRHLIRVVYLNKVFRQKVTVQAGEEVNLRILF